jgi:predicted TIM-barrel fold metal-dependent hydrolase
MNTSPISRRRFVGTLTAAAALPATLSRALAAETAVRFPDIPIIDTHIHLFDTERPGGIPWPPKSNPVLYKTALPDRYRRIAVPLGIKGAIEVEASPVLEDNQWVLDVAAKDTIIVGTVGNLEPGKPEFRAQLERFRRNPLFRGIRYGNLWGRNLSLEVAKPEFIADLKALADADLVLDSANPDPVLIESLLRASDRVPNLRIVIDHLPKLVLPKEVAALAAYKANLRELGRRPQVYVKISAVLQRVGDRVPEDLGHYRATLDELFGIFTENRVLFGSDWPNSDQIAEYPKVLAIVRQYFETKGRPVAEKYFWRNSVAAYKWVKREAGQPA